MSTGCLSSQPTTTWKLSLTSPSKPWRPVGITGTTLWWTSCSPSLSSRTRDPWLRSNGWRYSGNRLVIKILWPVLYLHYTVHLVRRDECLYCIIASNSWNFRELSLWLLFWMSNFQSLWNKTHRILHFLYYDTQQCYTNHYIMSRSVSQRQESMLVIKNIPEYRSHYPAADTSLWLSSRYAL